ncbi:Hexaprenyldihydroxybenzoate methyltransferase, mitochondrial-like protein [Gossypium australe]|uniref:Hexaprenyldihydroxybenzoate methyltransferase, mitochondrial-like protein n=1 Tax=Gossypium australe TaxID=47621 RepID=A0A5B6WWN4_9ROSI|nr:Hexaprenyldihydroxybenzoate methyltransferase, mitochondrial-like protein [Gossypium australe]
MRHFSRHDRNDPKAYWSHPQTQTFSISHRSLSENIRKYGAQEFRVKKEDDPSTVEYWLENTQRVLQQLCYKLKEKLECAVFLLKEEAYQWWNTVAHVVRPAQLTWDFFLAEFQKKYISELLLEERKREFLYLKQNDMTVTKYEQEFVRLSRYAKELVVTEADMCNRFERGLRGGIRLHLLAFKIQEFSTLVERALKAEQVIIEE